MGKKPQRHDWPEAKTLCRLNQLDIEMAKKLGFGPDALIRARPDPKQQWKLPVNLWIRELYAEKFGEALSAEPPPPTDVRQSWPDNPKMQPLPEYDPDELDVPYGARRYEPPGDADIDEQNTRMLRQQRLFRWAAQLIANFWSNLPDVQKVAAFGAVSQPLRKQIPRFEKFRRHGIKVLHECADLDLAVWVSGLDNLKALKKEMANALAFVQDTPYGGVAHHQVDVHFLDFASGDYRGRQCIFGQCPKDGKHECLVPRCGEKPFLRQFSQYCFNRARFEAEPKVVLFDRASRLLVEMPLIDGRYRFERIKRSDSDNDVPF
jgi:hypothetical protein